MADFLVKASMLFLAAIVLTGPCTVQSAPLMLGGPGGPGGPGEPGGPGGLGGLTLEQNQQLQTSVQKYTYALDEENAGYFRGEWVANSTRLYNRSKAHLNRTECGESRIPPEWKVERFQNSSNEEEGNGVQETAPPSVTAAPSPVLGRKKRFLSSNSSSCTTNRTTAVIRDEREDHVNQFPLSTTSTSSRILLRISSDDVFGDSGYPQSKEVVWQIELPESRKVVVDFESFELDRYSECGDYISIHNENGDLLRFCAQEKIEDINNSQNYLVGKRITVKFVAGASGNGVGFSADLI